MSSADRLRGACHAFLAAGLLALPQHQAAAAAPLPFPGVGHLRPNGSGYDWVPVNYAQVR